jgi:hypothetical protein
VEGVLVVLCVWHQRAHRGVVRAGGLLRPCTRPRLNLLLFLRILRASVLIQFDRNRHWSAQFQYISLFACENSHYLCTGTRAKAKNTCSRLRCRCVICAPGLYRNWVLSRMGKPRLRSN